MALKLIYCIKPIRQSSNQKNNTTYLSVSKIFSSFLVALVLAGTTHAQKLSLTITNKTGYHLDSLLFDQYYLGALPNDSSLIYTECHKLIMQSELPLHLPVAHIGGKPRRIALAPCSTKSVMVKSGNYAFDILIYETGDRYRLYWKKSE
jgi:hypothetical protein